MDGEDGGYTYASNVDNHRSLMADMCDIKAHANAGEWTAAKGIYMSGITQRRATVHTELLQALLQQPVRTTTTIHTTALTDLLTHT
jgi:hypothetical protein